MHPGLWNSLIRSVDRIPPRCGSHKRPNLLASEGLSRALWRGDGKDLVPSTILIQRQIYDSCPIHFVKVYLRSCRVIGHSIAELTEDILCGVNIYGMPQ
jgi:hypothetical protein